MSDEITKAKEYAARLRAKRETFTPKIESAISKAFEKASMFDIETGGLDPKSPIYESGFQHGIDKPTYSHLFVKPTNIAGTKPGDISGFTENLLTTREKTSPGIRDLIQGSNISQKEAARSALSEMSGRDVWVQNLQFERRFLDARTSNAAFKSWAHSANLESFSHSGGIYTTSLNVKRAVVEANTAAGKMSSLDNYLGKWANVFGELDTALQAPRQQGVTRAFDMLDLTRSVFAMAQQKGAMEKTGELFAGASIDSLSRALYGKPELHTSLGDSALQGELARFLYGTGKTLQAGGELSKTQKQFFSKISQAQPVQKQRNLTKNIINTFRAQQRYLGEAAQGNYIPDLLREARIDTKTKTYRSNLDVLQPDGTYKKESFSYVGRDYKNPRYSTDINEVVDAWKVRDANRWGVELDYERAMSEAQEYIGPYNSKLKELGGDRLRALSEMEELAESIHGRINEEVGEAFSKGSKQGFIKRNWKIGAGIAGAIGLYGWLFSGKDDEYNYIEGMRHAGISGETRKYNTDFGSGWRGPAALAGGVLGAIGLSAATDIGVGDIGFMAGAGITGYDRFGAKGGAVGVAAGAAWLGASSLLGDGFLGTVAGGIEGSAMTSMFASSMMKGGTLEFAGRAVSKGFSNLVGKASGKFLESEAGINYAKSQGLTTEAAKKQMTDFLDLTVEDPRGLFAVIQEGGAVLKDLGTAMRKDPSSGIGQKAVGGLIGSLTNPYVQGFLGSPQLAKGIQKHGTRVGLEKHFASAEMSGLGVTAEQIEYIGSGSAVGGFSKKRYMEVLREKDFKGHLNRMAKEKVRGGDHFEEARRKVTEEVRKAFNPYEDVKVLREKDSMELNIGFSMLGSRLKKDRVDEIFSVLDDNSRRLAEKNRDKILGLAETGLEQKKKLQWDNFDVNEYIKSATSEGSFLKSAVFYEPKGAAQYLKKAGMRDAIHNRARKAVEEGQGKGIQEGIRKEMHNKFKYTEDEMAQAFMRESQGLKDIPAADYAKLNALDLYYGATGGIAVGLGFGAIKWTFSGKDDEYNTIEGLKHKGFAGKNRKKNTDFGSGWQGLAGAAAASLIGGIGVGIATGSWMAGFSAFNGGLGGASLGYLKGGAIGGAIGGIAGALASGGLAHAGNEYLGGFGGAAVAGVSTSLSASLAMAGNMRGGLFYKGVMGAMKKQAGSAEEFDALLPEFAEIMKGLGIDMLGPTGFAANTSDMLRAQANNIPQLKGISKWFDEHDFARKMLDASLGSPKLIEAAKKAGGAENIATGELAKAIGWDIIEGAPVGVATGLIGLAFSGDGKSEKRSNRALNPQEGMGHKGYAGANRKHNTDFGSPWQGIKKVLGMGRRATRVGTTLAKENMREVSHIFKHQIIPGAAKGKPMEMGLVGLTGYEMFHMATTAMQGSMTASSFMAGMGSLVGSKYLYMGIKNRKAVMQAIKNPDLVALALGKATGQVKKYIGSDKGLLKPFFDAGGGKAGRDATKGAVNKLIRDNESRAEELYDTLDILGHKDKIPQAREVVSRFVKKAQAATAPSAQVQTPRVSIERQSSNIKSFTEDIAAKEAIVPTKGRARTKPINSLKTRKNKSADKAMYAGLGIFGAGTFWAMSGSSDSRDFGSPWHGLNNRYDGTVASLKIRDYDVEDADTVNVTLENGQELSLRLAGIDAPEIEHGDEYASRKVFQNQPYGEEATDFLKELLSNQSELTAVFDPLGEGTYGRTPALLFGDDGTNLNLSIVKAGAAASLPFGKASNRLFSAREFNSAQKEAYDASLGMWSDPGWRAAYDIQRRAKRKITHNTFTDLEKLFGNFKAASIVQRLRNPDADFSSMLAAGGRDDFNIQEGLMHGWAQSNREKNLGDFGSGYRVDKVIETMRKSTKVHRKLVKGQYVANTHSRRMLDPKNWKQHHIG